MKFGDMPKELQDNFLEKLIASTQGSLLATTIHFEDQPDVIICILECCIINFVMGAAIADHYHPLMNEICDHLKKGLKDAIRQKNMAHH